MECSAGYFTVCVPDDWPGHSLGCRSHQYDNNNTVEWLVLFLLCLSGRSLGGIWLPSCVSVCYFSFRFSAQLLKTWCWKLHCRHNMVFSLISIVKLLVATLHVGMTRKQDGGYTQWTQLQRDYLRWVKRSFTHQWLELCMDDERLHRSLQQC